VKIIKNKPSKSGDFDLMPEEGWQLTSFNDFTSNLLIV